MTRGGSEGGPMRGQGSPMGGQGSPMRGQGSLMSAVKVINNGYTGQRRPGIAPEAEGGEL